MLEEMIKFLEEYGYVDFGYNGSSPEPTYWFSISEESEEDPTVLEPICFVEGKSIVEAYSRMLIDLHDDGVELEDDNEE